MGILKLLHIAWRVAKAVGIVIDLLPVTSTVKLWLVQKKVKQTEQVLEAVITGVKRYQDAPVSSPDSVITVIKMVAQSIPGAEERLNRFVKRVKAKLGK
jgi:hypothetical protein